MKSKYLDFKITGHCAKTKIFSIYSKADEYLGSIKWQPTWRSYAFFPAQFTMWSEGCLEDVRIFIKEEMEKHKKKARKYICCLCKEENIEFGNNPAPLKKKGECCDECNRTKVIPARFKHFKKEKVKK